MDTLIPGHSLAATVKMGNVNKAMNEATRKNQEFMMETQRVQVNALRFLCNLLYRCIKFYYFANFTFFLFHLCEYLPTTETECPLSQNLDS